jgi:hypothetical protein
VRTLGRIVWLLAAFVAFAPSLLAQLDDELLFPIEYSILPELVPGEGIAIALPRTVDSTRIFIDLKNTSDKPYEGALSLKIGVKAGPWTLSQPTVEAEGFTCSGDNKNKTCSKPLFILRQGETLRIIQPIVCPIFSTELTRIELSGPEVPTEEFTIKQHSSPFGVVAGHSPPVLDSGLHVFNARLSIKLLDPPGFTGRAGTLTGLSGGTETIVGPPGGTLYAGTPPCPPTETLICPTVPFTFAPGQSLTIDTPIRTRVGTTTPSVLFSLSFPDNPTVAGFNVTFPVRVPLLGPDPEASFERSFNFNDAAGGTLLLHPSVVNLGSVKTTGPVTATVVLSVGLSSQRGRNFTLTFPDPIEAGRRARLPEFYVYFREAGPANILVTISGGGDVRNTNNVDSFSLEILATQDDTLERDAEMLGRILGGR